MRNAAVVSSCSAHRDLKIGLQHSNHEKNQNRVPQTNILLFDKSNSGHHFSDMIHVSKHFYNFHFWQFLLSLISFPCMENAVAEVGTPIDKLKKHIS